MLQISFSPRPIQWYTFTLADYDCSEKYSYHSIHKPATKINLIFNSSVIICGLQFYSPGNKSPLISPRVIIKVSRKSSENFLPQNAPKLLRLRKGIALIKVSKLFKSWLSESADSTRMWKDNEAPLESVKIVKTARDCENRLRRSCFGHVSGKAKNKIKEKKCVLKQNK